MTDMTGAFDPGAIGLTIERLATKAMAAIGRSDATFDHTVRDLVVYLIGAAGGMAHQAAGPRATMNHLEAGQRRARVAIKQGLKTAAYRQRRDKKLRMGIECLDLMARGKSQKAAREQVAKQFGTSRFTVDRCVAPARRYLAAHEREDLRELAHAGRARPKKWV